MAQNSLADKIAAAKARKDRAAARLNALEAQAKGIERKRDTRRKIIVGGVVLAAMQKDGDFAAGISRLLAAYVGRAQDKELISDLLAQALQPPQVSAPAATIPSPGPFAAARAAVPDHSQFKP